MYNVLAHFRGECLGPLAFARRIHERLIPGIVAILEHPSCLYSRGIENSLRFPFGLNLEVVRVSARSWKNLRGAFELEIPRECCLGDPSRLTCLAFSVDTSELARHVCGNIRGGHRSREFSGEWSYSVIRLVRARDLQWCAKS